jgi:hypothetical protein
MSKREIEVTIKGGDAFERDCLTSEIIALLESINVVVSITRPLEVLDSEEHEDHVRSLAKSCVVIIKRQP